MGLCEIVVLSSFSGWFVGFWFGFLIGSGDGL